MKLDFIEPRGVYWIGGVGETRTYHGLIAYKNGRYITAHIFINNGFYFYSEIVACNINKKSVYLCVYLSLVIWPLWASTS